MLTCKEFLSELTDFLDERTDAALRSKLEKHMQDCPNCWVVCDTTRKTIAIYKDQNRQCCVPPDVESRLMAAVERKIAAKAQKV